MSNAESAICGDANPGGNIAFFFKGGCRKPVAFRDAFRCTGCGGFFHRDCIFDHFEREEGHSVAHNALHKIKEYIGDTMTTIHVQPIKKMCKEGLSREWQRKSLLPFL